MTIRCLARHCECALFDGMAWVWPREPGLMQNSQLRVVTSNVKVVVKVWW